MPNLRDDSRRLVSPSRNHGAGGNGGIEQIIQRHSARGRSVTFAS